VVLERFALSSSGDGFAVSNDYAPRCVKVVFDVDLPSLLAEITGALTLVLIAIPRSSSTARTGSYLAIRPLHETPASHRRPLRKLSSERCRNGA